MHLESFLFLFLFLSGFTGHEIRPRSFSLTTETVVRPIISRNPEKIQYQPDSSQLPLDSTILLTARLYTLACNAKIDTYQARLTTLGISGKAQGQLEAQLKKYYPERQWRGEGGWEILNDEVQAAPQQAWEFAERLTAVPAEHQSETYGAAMSRLLAEDFQGAIQVLRSDNWEARLAKNHKLASSSHAKPKPAHQKAEAQTILDLEQALLLAELQALSADLSSADSTYQAALVFAPPGHAIAFAYGRFLRNHFRYDQAKTYFQNLTAQLRSLSQQQPEIYRPALARALFEWGSLQTMQGEMAAAKTALDESLNIRRELAQQQPAIHTPDWIATLLEMGQWYTLQFQHSQSRTVRKEATDLARVWAGQHPQEGLPLLAQCLHDYGQALFVLKDFTGGQSTLEEAIAIRKDLSERYPSLFLPALAHSMTILASQRTGTVNDGYASQLFEDALQIYSDLTDAQPGIYQPVWAATLCMAGGYHRENQNYSAAKLYLGEALDKYESLILVHPTSYQPQLAEVKEQIGQFFRIMGDPSQAYLYYEEALAIHRAYAKREPDRYTPRIIHAQIQMGWLALEGYDPTLAQKHLQEALEICQKQVAKAPKIYQPLMAECLQTCGDVQLDQKQYLAARNYLVEALGFYRPLASAEPEIYLPALATTLHQMGKAYWAEALISGAMEAFTEAMALRESLFQQHPLDYGKDAAHTAEVLREIYIAQLERSPSPDVQAQGLSLCKRSNQFLAVYDAHTLRRFREDIARLKDLLGRDTEFFYSRDPAFEAMQARVQALNKVGKTLQDFAQKASHQAELVQVMTTMQDSFPGYPTYSEDYFIALNQLAENQLWGQQFSEAAATAQKALQLKPGHPWAQETRAHALLLQGNLDEAEPYYLDLCKYPGGEFETYCAKLLNDLDKFEAAGITHPDFTKARKLLENAGK